MTTREFKEKKAAKVPEVAGLKAEDHQTEEGRDNRDMRQPGRRPQTLTFIDQNKTEIISRRVLLVHVSERGRKIESAQEQPNGNCFA